MRLKNMYDSIKADRMNMNKQRYDDQTLFNAQLKDQHNMRMEMASKKEQEMIARMAHTMNAQKQAIANLEQAINQNKMQKKSRVDGEPATLRHSFSTGAHVRNKSSYI